MKTKLIVSFLFVAASIALARMENLFSSWDEVENHSADIVLARCEKQIPLTNTVANGPTSDFSIEVLAVLKGATNIKSARLWTDHNLRQNENYLVFGHYDNGIYQAYEEFRVIPLGKEFSTNVITGKPFDEQIQILFKLRIDQLNRQIKADQAEKERLEQGLKR